MKDGIIEQLDTPAKIVLNPATEYVRKFTEEVPREKVLKIEVVMDPMNDNQNLSDLQVSKDAIIETVIEKILSQEKKSEALIIKLLELLNLPKSFTLYLVEEKKINNLWIF